MLHAVCIIDQGNCVLRNRYWGPQITDEMLSRILELIRSKQSDVTVYPFKLVHEDIKCLVNNVHDTLFFFTISSDDSLDNYYLKLEAVKRAIESNIEKMRAIKWSTDTAGYKEFVGQLNRILGDIHKVCIIGAPDVGKISLSKVLTGQEPRPETIPSIGLEIIKVPGLFMGKYELTVWEYDDDESFSSFMDYYLKEASLIFLVTDSSPINVRKTKDIVSRLRTELPSIPLAVYANKQDLPNAWPPKMIERVLATPTQGVVVTDPRYNNKIIEFFNTSVKRIH
ncbi:MAG: ADP-ribosylation factor-like protein [Candidatus Ranarchaeia archaeon]